ncbi:MAG: 4'-phosphopantetheinyl transferase superfamily protein [Bacteroidales bacterium]|jgi:4'-phosphopantetheinyl transferase EntD|nr:4'-phosphopantetheinyl transferase superfamily protein [Bacteroidales bacterium]
MPLILRQSFPPDIELGIWEIIETEEKLLSGLELSPIDKDYILNQPLEKRKIEKLACRKIVNHLIENSKVSINYGSFGNPLMKDYLVSFSHSKKYAAIALSKTKPVGIDIEKIEPKIIKLSSKFISQEEAINIDLQDASQITAIWTAKEAVYKLFYEEKLDFLKQIKVIKGEATVFLKDTPMKVQLFQNCLDNSCFSVAVRK